MFKALFVGHLFAIRSGRQLVREIAVDVACRWFLGLKLTDKVLDASTLSRNRRRRCRDTTVAQAIFDRIVEQAMSCGLVDGTVPCTDSTHLKANADRNRHDRKAVARSRCDHRDDLDAAIDEDRAAHGKKPLKERDRKPVEKETRVSRTDPEAGHMVRDGKPKGFFHLDHRTVDGKLGIITDTHATPANVHDGIVHLDRLDRQRARFGFDTRIVGLDAGHAATGIAKGHKDRDIRGVTGCRNPTPPRPAMMRKSTFIHEPHDDGHRCPQGQLLSCATTERNGCRHYGSDPAICKSCPLLASCTTSAKAQRTIARHVWADSRERTDRHRPRPWGKAICKRRKETVERSLADARQPHGHRTAIAMHGSEVQPGLHANACWPPQHGISGKSQMLWRKGHSQRPHEAKDTSRPSSKPQDTHQEQDPASKRRGSSAA